MKTGPVRLTLQLQGQRREDDAAGDAALRRPRPRTGNAGWQRAGPGDHGQPGARGRIARSRCSRTPWASSWLEGRSTIAVALAGQGVSERQIVEHLERQGRLGNRQWHDRGRSTSPRSCAASSRGRFSGLRHRPRREDAIQRVRGHLHHHQRRRRQPGPAAGEPAVRVTGAGSFNLPARSLDYTVRPKIAALNANTDRAVINLSNVEIPVRIEGLGTSPTSAWRARSRSWRP